MLYLIGLGLKENSLTEEALRLLKKVNKIYLEKYTSVFPYSLSKLKSVIKKDIEELSREDIEGEEIVLKAKLKNIALLVYGDALSATTHISLILKCKQKRIAFKIIHNSSVFTAIAETGLQLYKFGKTSSMPKWEKHFEPESFINYVKQNLSINAHSLILVDIGLEFKEALNELDESCKDNKIKLDKIIICSCLGTDKQKILYGTLNKLSRKKIKNPFCIIIPSKLHFIEEKSLKRFGI